MSTGGDGAARRQALKMLERRMLSRAELRGKLVRRGHDEACSERVVATLAREGTIDDRALGESIVRLELGRSPAGAALLEAKLAKRGIEREVCRDVVREALRGRSGVDDAEVVARRRARALASGLPAEVKRRRVLGALSRRGFNAEAAREAVERVLGEDCEGG